MPDDKGLMDKVERRPLVAQVIERLRAQITSGVWPIGGKVPSESALCVQLGVGRSTLREAVKVLTYEGLLEVRQGAGTFVRSTAGRPGAGVQQRLRRAEVLDVYEVRMAIETAAARLACARRTEEDLERINAALRARRPRGSAAFIEADLAFHAAIVDAAHNTAFSEVFEAFTERLRSALTLLISDDSARERVDDAHAALAHAIRDRDAAAAEAATASNLEATAQRLRALLDPDELGS